MWLHVIQIQRGRGMIISKLGISKLTSAIANALSFEWGVVST